ncbi:MAG: class I SAM-dependent methyltransferase [Acidobacteriota bacterium]
MREFLFGNAVKMAQQVIEQLVDEYDIVVDATCGNGHDTLFLARLVPNGRVLAFDKAEQAIASTTRQLALEGVQERVEMYHRDFRDIPQVVESPVKAIMFNMGYLPGGPRETVTSADESKAAVIGALPLLASGGAMTIVCYERHPGGQEEADAIRSFVSGLDQQIYEVLEMRFLNQINQPPVLIVVYKR